MHKSKTQKRSKAKLINQTVSNSCKFNVIISTKNEIKKHRRRKVKPKTKSHELDAKQQHRPCPNLQKIQTNGRRKPEVIRK